MHLFVGKADAEGRIIARDKIGEAYTRKASVVNVVDSQTGVRVIQRRKRIAFAEKHILKYPFSRILHLVFDIVDQIEPQAVVG